MTHKKTLYLFVISIVVLATHSGCHKEVSKPVEVKRVKVVMKKYSITPGEIRVKKGDLLQFEVSTEDVQHGFSIPDLKINEPVNPGKSSFFTYYAQKKGVFVIECSVMCGSGHDDMRALLMVE